MQHGSGVLAIIGGHRVEIEIQPETAAFLVDETADSADIFIGVNDLISGYRVGKALYRDAPTLLAVDPLANGRVGFIWYEDFAGRSGGFKPRSEVHAAADDRLVHPVLAAEVPDSAISGIDSDPTLEGFFDTRRSPDLVQLS